MVAFLIFFLIFFSLDWAEIKTAQSRVKLKLKVIFTGFDYSVGNTSS
jgi:hypothetical protein